MPNYAIEIEGLWKQYRLGERQSYVALRDILSDPLSAFRGKPKEEFWALKDINLKVKEGEVLGVIGKNGSGKSTLLKILTQITPPTKGQIKLHGRVASLLEVGTGFNPELTGRENIYLNGSILGMTRAEIRRKFDEIVDFSGVEKFIDTPVKRYSSGMYVRLAFAVAAHLESEILLVDEVLAVGDMEFQKKCLGKMHDVALSGKTVLFVSHNMGSINSLCDTAILLNEGAKILEGPSKKVVSTYTKLHTTSTSSYSYKKQHADNKAIITKVEILNHLQKPIDTVLENHDFTIAISYKITSYIDKCVLELAFFKDGVCISVVSDAEKSGLFKSKSAGSYKSLMHFSGTIFKHGMYTIEAALKYPGVEFYSRRQEILFNVKNDYQDYEYGCINIKPIIDTKFIK